MAAHIATKTPTTSRVDTLKRQAAVWQEKGTKTIEKRVVQAKDVATVAKKKSVEFADLAKKRSSEVVTDRGVQVAAVSALGGGVVVGAGGAATGLVAGGAMGAAMGILPALFTFGLSIPVGAVMGAGCGAAVGGTVGGVTGFTGAGAIGYSAYAKRADLQAAAARAKTIALNTYYLVLAGKQRAVAKVASARAEARRHVLRHAAVLKEICITAMGIGIQKSTEAKAIASDKDVQATAAAAAGGAVALGAGGAATGLVAGGALGAVVGVVPAFLTFGLSIPFCAVVGGGLGLVAGTGVGGTAGAVAGAGVYTKRETIKGYVGAVTQKATTSAKSVKARLQGSTA